MFEQGYFPSGPNELFYSLVVPNSKAGRTGIVFVHAADGNRLGPHRMFVELAGRFNSLGYPTFRFDLSGCGDSTGTPSPDNIGSEVFDVTQAAGFFAGRACLDNVVLFGISRGARVCFAAMEHNAIPLAGMILLSAPVSSAAAALKSVMARLKEYGHKFKDPRQVWKLLSGKADIRQVIGTLVSALQLRKRYAQTTPDVCASACPVLFIYGEKDPIAKESSQYYLEKCRQNGLSQRCHFIADGNHSFFHYKWKEEIFSVSKQWLQEVLTRSENGRMCK